MDSELLAVLADPVDGTALAPDGADALLSGGGRRYAVRAGIPRFVRVHDEGQDQTAGSFGWKWAQRDVYEAQDVRTWTRAWFLERYGFERTADVRARLAGRRVLDVGCGAGFTASLWLGDDEGDPWDGSYTGLDISSGIDVAQARLGRPGRSFVQGDALELPFRAGAFDVAIAEGVLHHTPSTRAALASMARVVRPGGELWLYVYRRKSPVREFTDDYVRNIVAPLAPDDAWELMRPLTLLGKALADTGGEVTVPEDVEVLGIPAGTYSVQRLFYWHVAKLFWNDAHGLEASQLANFDWFHPRYAHRQSPEEVAAWCEELGLRIDRMQVEDAGITVLATRVGAAGAP